MSAEISTLIEHGALAFVLWFIIQTVLLPMINRLMTRLDTITDKLITIIEKQEQIVAQQQNINAQIAETTFTAK